MAASNEQELLLILQSLEVIRDEVNANLDALAARIKRLLPPETSTRY